MSDATITRGPAAFVALGSVYSGAVAYVTLLIAARGLTPQDNATFLVFWALMFGLFGVVTGVSSESARTSFDAALGERGASVLGVALGFGALVAAAAVAVAVFAGRRILPDHGSLWLVAAAACLAYTGHLAIWGVVTGRRQWLAAGGIMIAESTVRLLLVAVAFAAYGTLDALAVAAALPALTWVACQAIIVFRRAARSRSDVSASRLLRNYAVASLASSAGALLMVGFPILIAATSTPAEVAVSAGLILGITLTRAPLLLPLTALQGVALTHFLRTRSRAWRALGETAGPVLGVSVLGAGLALLIGPWLFWVLLGGTYAIDGVTLALLTLSAGLLATLTLTGMFALALHRHALFAAGWVCGTAGALLWLLSSLPITDRVILGLLTGPVLGVAVHVIGLSRRGAPSPAAR